MRRGFLIALLAVGTVGGYAAGFARMSHCNDWREERRAAFERHVAEVCVDAARRADGARSTGAAATPPPGPGAAVAPTFVAWPVVAPAPMYAPAAPAFAPPVFIDARTTPPPPPPPPARPAPREPEAPAAH